jgi:hypothetical protein
MHANWPKPPVRVQCNFVPPVVAGAVEAVAVAFRTTVLDSLWIGGGSVVAVVAVAVVVAVVVAVLEAKFWKVSVEEVDESGDTIR